MPSAFGKQTMRISTPQCVYGNSIKKSAFPVFKGQHRPYRIMAVFKSPSRNSVTGDGLAEYTSGIFSWVESKLTMKIIIRFRYSRLIWRTLFPVFYELCGFDATFDLFDDTIVHRANRLTEIDTEGESSENGEANEINTQFNDPADQSLESNTAGVFIDPVAIPEEPDSSVAGKLTALNEGQQERESHLRSRNYLNGY